MNFYVCVNVRMHVRVYMDSCYATTGKSRIHATANELIRRRDFHNVQKSTIILYIIQNIFFVLSANYNYIAALFKMCVFWTFALDIPLKKFNWTLSVKN